MKSLYSFAAILVALAIYSEAASVQDRAVATRSNLYLGRFVPGDVLLSREYHSKDPIPNVVQYLWIFYVGSSQTRFSIIQVTEVGTSQGATPAITEGGVGYNNATIMLTSAPSKGFHYKIEIWGR